ncbi:MAG: serine/threonine-protein phosphatase [Ruminococcus sp.]|nr:serine/threonine-protein phosphatase [Ruminococcus sp.]
MDFIASAVTDIGITKDTNQDSFGVKVLNTRLGSITIAIICDGMGGYSHGEIASATVVKAFDKWILERLPVLCNEKITDSIIKNEWTQIINDCNNKISSYGKQKGITLGTTATIMMLTPTRYFIMNVGDSRAYEISNDVKVLTKDQTVVAKDVELGYITEEQAKTDPRRSVLLYAIGASYNIVPDMFYGETKKDAVYMLCSDGFRHEITSDEIYSYMNPSFMSEMSQMKQNMESLINLNKQRQETDNITVVAVRTY